MSDVRPIHELSIDRTSCRVPPSGRARRKAESARHWRVARKKLITHVACVRRVRSPDRTRRNFRTSIFVFEPVRGQRSEQAAAEPPAKRMVFRLLIASYSYTALGAALYIGRHSSQHGIQLGAQWTLRDSL
eukprot:1308715-Prymnesium_polylepis.3